MSLFKSLQHLSGNTINSFICRKNSLYLSKILGKPFETNPNMCRGKAVEGAINEWVDGRIKSDAEIPQTALRIYDLEIEPYRLLNPDCPEIQKKRDQVEGCAIAAFNHYFDIYEFSKPTTQCKITARYDGIDIDLIGYLDYYRYQKEVRDCKVVAAGAKSVFAASLEYCVTGAIYHIATGCPVYYDLVVAKKKPDVTSLKMTDEEIKFGLSYGMAAAKAIIELQDCNDPARFFELMCFPDLGSMYNKGEQKEAAERWGIYWPEEKVESEN